MTLLASDFSVIFVSWDFILIFYRFNHPPQASHPPNYGLAKQEGLLAYPYSTRELVKIVRHLEAWKSESGVTIGSRFVERQPARSNMVIWSQNQLLRGVNFECLEIHQHLPIINKRTYHPIIHSGADPSLSVWWLDQYIDHGATEESFPDDPVEDLHLAVVPCWVVHDGYRTMVDGWWMLLMVHG